MPFFPVNWFVFRVLSFRRNRTCVTRCSVQYPPFLAKEFAVWHQFQASQAIQGTVQAWMRWQEYGRFPNDSWAIVEACSRSPNRVHSGLIWTSHPGICPPKPFHLGSARTKWWLTPFIWNGFGESVSDNHTVLRGWISLISFVSWSTVVMRAKRRRRAYSVRSRMASTPSSSPGLSQFGIGKVIVASVTKSTA